ncbi:hypothetical protein [Candidatus Poriferisodalis sp.]|uniref:hypothetical protein n=1 Tax=Candidatus Poriferisodalis sp. TaxID=3101277 RepID=UPI003B022E8E
MALVLSPWASVLPGDAQGRFGETPAAAQTPAVVSGEADVCPEYSYGSKTLVSKEDDHDRSLCVLNLDRCPVSPLDVHGVNGVNGKRFMQHSIVYVSMCEDAANENGFVDPVQETPSLTYPDADHPLKLCEEMTGAFVSKEDSVCRITMPAKCPATVGRVVAEDDAEPVSPTPAGPEQCRVYFRRTWTCPVGATPWNSFNTCYTAPTERADEADHPACSGVTQSFPVGLSCDDYVGDDFMRVPTARDCSSFVTGDPGDPNSSALSNYSSNYSSNKYWCMYDRVLLEFDCRKQGAKQGDSCSRVDALCIKRASRVAGCDAVADAIRCRGIQARLAENPDMTAHDAYAVGCAPCIVLPFRPTPSECPEDYDNEMDRQPGPRVLAHPSFNSLRTQFAQAFHTQRDWFYGAGEPCRVYNDKIGDPDVVLTTIQNDWDTCAKQGACLDPPTGRLTLVSTHQSGNAIVNSPVIMTLTNAVQGIVSQHYQYDGDKGLHIRRYTRYVYGDSDHRHRTVWTWFVPEDVEHRTVRELVSRGMCVIHPDPDEAPQYHFHIRELWPDRPEDRERIEELFGEHALVWWDGLATDDERQKVTRARGFSFWDELGNAEAEDQEERARQATLRCVRGATVSCRWTPTRAGYYEVRGDVAWKMMKLQPSHKWRQPSERDELHDLFASLKSDGCPEGLSDAARVQDRDCIAKDLQDWGLTADDAGLADGLVGLKPIDGGDDYLLEKHPDSTLRLACPSPDLRIRCPSVGGGAVAMNWAELPTVGIVVYDGRVVPRSVSGR